MRNGLGQDRLHVVGRHIVALAQQGLGLGGAHDGNTGAWTQALQEPLAGAGSGDQVLDVVEQRIGGMYGQHVALQLLQLRRRQQTPQGLHDIAPVMAVEQFALGRAVRVTE